MLTKKLALALLVGIIGVSIMGCSSTSKSNNQFIEVHVVDNGGISQNTYINVNHIVTVRPSGTSGAIMLMDRSDGMNAGTIRVTESYEQIVQKLVK